MDRFGQFWVMSQNPKFPVSDLWSQCCTYLAISPQLKGISKNQYAYDDTRATILYQHIWELTAGVVPVLRSSADRQHFWHFQFCRLLEFFGHNSATTAPINSTNSSFDRAVPPLYACQKLAGSVCSLRSNKQMKFSGSEKSKKLVHFSKFSFGPFVVGPE